MRYIMFLTCCVLITMLFASCTTEIPTPDTDALDQEEEESDPTGTRQISGFSAISSPDGTTIAGPSLDELIVSENDLPINIIAYSETVRPVEFYIDGEFERTENVPHYTLAGNDADNYYAWSPSPGSYDVLAVQGEDEANVTVTVLSDDSESNTGTEPDEDGGSSDAGSLSPSDGTHGEVRLLNKWGWQKGQALNIEGFMYYPNDVGAEPYEGFDRLITTDVRDRNFRFLFGFTRPATLVMAWPDGRNAPSWTSDWEQGAEISLDGSTYDTYVETFSAGETLLPEFGELSVQPTFLIGEVDGSASEYPTAPSGYEQPVPNERCPDWVHDQYVVEHEGETYRSWHPQIDPAYACNFEHEHGSDPSLFAGDWEPLFNRYEGISTPLGTTLGPENHEGFKVFVTAPHEGVEMMVTLHASSGSLRRVCTRFHATDKVFADADSGEILANLAYKGDFGWPRLAGDNRLDPSACPDAIELTGTGGRRDFKRPDAGEGYEPWLEGLGTAGAFPFEGKLFWGLDNPQTKCGDRTRCDSVIPVGLENADGTRRFIDFVEGFSIDANSGLWGSFCTDVYGFDRVSCDDENAIEQYINEGFEWSPPRARWSVTDPFTAEYEPSFEPQLLVFNLDRNINKGVPVPGVN